MHATLDVNSEEKLMESVTMLRSARRIIVTGIGASGLVAQNFARKLLKIGFNAVVERDMHALLATVQALSPNDLLLAISYTGERRELNRLRMKRCAPARKSSPSPDLHRTPCSNGQVIVCTPLPRSRPRAAQRFLPLMRK